MLVRPVARTAIDSFTWALQRPRLEQPLMSLIMAVESDH